MAAVFPLDTTKPWTFNGVTYEYDANDDRWYVVSTVATDQVVENLDELERGLDITNTIIDQEIENRSNLLDAATSKNNQQDASILELDQRLDAISDAAGTLQFKGRYTYVLEKSEEACTQAYLACLIAAAGDPVAAGECSNIDAACNAALDEPYSNGTFTSKGTTNVISDIEEFVITGIDLDGQSIDWLNVAEVGDYLEMFGIDDGDTALYEIIEEPIGGAHRDRNLMLKNIKKSLTENLQNFKLSSSDEILSHRKNKFLKIGRQKGFIENIEDLSSLKPKSKDFNQIIKSKKIVFISIGLIFLGLISLLFFL